MLSEMTQATDDGDEAGHDPKQRLYKLGQPSAGRQPPLNSCEHPSTPMCWTMSEGHQWLSAENS
jgi:hypothetical protein